MIAAISMVFLAYASPLANATNYIWTTPNMPSNIAGVVAGPFARPEDVAYIHEAIAERRVLGGSGSGSSTVPESVVRTPSLPLTPAQAQANGWMILSTGIVDGAVNVLAYMETVTNWPKAGGVDTWRMEPITFSLPGGNWIAPENDVSNLTAATGESFTNCFNPWRGYMQATNISLRGLAWRPAITNVLHRLDAYSLDLLNGYSLTNTAIRKYVSTDYNVEYGADGKSIHPVPDNDEYVVTNSADMGFSAVHKAFKVSRSYTDGDGNLVPCSGSPLSYRAAEVRSTVGSMPGGQDVRLYVPVPYCFSTGGVWRVVEAAHAIARVYYIYHHRRYIGDAVELVTNTSGFVCLPVPVQADSTREDENGDLVVAVSTPLHEIASAAVQFAGLPTSDSGFEPPLPQGQMMADDRLENRDEEELFASVGSIHVILTVKPLTTIQELQ